MAPVAMLARVTGNLSRQLLREKLLTPKTCQGIQNIVCRGIVIHDEWKPGPYPKTPEERAAAAKKYGMTVEDYKPYPDDGFGAGDYPDLPKDRIGENAPYTEAYLYHELRHHYGHPVHMDQDVYRESRLDSLLQERAEVPLWRMAATVVAFVSFAMAALIFGKDYTIPILEKARFYPYNNLFVEYGGNPSKMIEVKHYTFEPVE